MLYAKIERKGGGEGCDYVKMPDRVTLTAPRLTWLLRFTIYRYCPARPKFHASIKITRYLSENHYSVLGAPPAPGEGI